MRALVIGATGATGRDLVEELLADTDYREVVVFVRRSFGLTHPKLMEVLTDFDKPEAVAGLIKGDVLFSCLGTTLKAAGGREKQWQVDYEIPAKFAGIALQNEVSALVLLSALGASANSRVFYSKLKGRLEEYMTGLGFVRCIIFRPGLLLRKNTDRWGERVAATVLKALNGLGLLKKYRPISTILLAAKLARAAKITTPGIHVTEAQKIFEF